MKLCKECLRVNGHHAHCPEAEEMRATAKLRGYRSSHMLEPTFTLWLTGRAVDDRLSSESAMRAAAKLWGFNPSTVIEDGEADILDEYGVLIGGCYKNE